ncbi:MAG: hypothetical protein WKF58_15270 [Ilumatobacteraceae bacterium]
MQSRIFDFEDDPDYTTGTVRPAAARTPHGATGSSTAPGGYAWAVTSTDDFGVDDWDLEADHSGQYGLGSYAGLNDGAAVAAAGGAGASVDDDLVREMDLGDRPRRTGVDPLLLRLGIIIAVAVMAVPIAIGLGGNDADSAGSVDETTETTAAPPAREETEDAASEKASDASSAERAARRERRAERSATEVSEVPSDDESAVKNKSGVEAMSATESDADASATDTGAACGVDYEVVAGDYWTRIADGSQAPLEDLLSANGANVDTLAVPGSDDLLADQRDPAAASAHHGGAADDRSAHHDRGASDHCGHDCCAGSDRGPGDDGGDDTGDHTADAGDNAAHAAHAGHNGTDAAGDDVAAAAHAAHAGHNGTDAAGDDVAAAAARHHGTASAAAADVRWLCPGHHPLGVARPSRGTGARHRPAREQLRADGRELLLRRALPDLLGGAPQLARRRRSEREVGSLRPLPQRQGGVRALPAQWRLGPLVPDELLILSAIRPHSWGRSRVENRRPTGSQPVPIAGRTH